jgi:hypothetical protein
LKKSKEELEKAINESLYFTIPSDSNMEAARESAKGKLVTDIWDYCRYYWYASQEKSMQIFEECDDKVFTCIFDCIRNFSADKGVFLNYLKKAISHLTHEFQMDETIKIYYELDHIQNDSDGEEHSVIEETVPSHYKESEEVMPETINTEKLLDAIEVHFTKKLDSIKPYLQKLLTLKLFDALTLIPNLKQNYSFVDYDMLKKYTSVEYTPTQKDIAAPFDKLESDASRTLRNFLKKIANKAEIKEIAKEFNINC